MLTQSLAHLVGWGEEHAGNRFSIGFDRIVALLKVDAYKTHFLFIWVVFSFSTEIGI